MKENHPGTRRVPPVWALAAAIGILAFSIILPVRAASLHASVPGWKTCRNTKMGFTFEFPRSWKIIYHSDAQGAASMPLMFKTSCNVPKNPGGYFGLSVARHGTGGPGLYMEVCDRSCMGTSRYSRARTLEQYLAMKPVDLSNNPVAEKLRLGGMSAVRLQDGTLLVFHDGRKYQLYFRTVTPLQTRQRLLNTFKFIDGIKVSPK